MTFRVRILAAALASVAAVVAVTDAYVSAAMRRALIARMQGDVFARLDLAAREASRAATWPEFRAWDALADDLGRAAAARITLVRTDGVVVGDSEVDAGLLSAVENQAARPEVAAALAGRRGFDVPRRPSAGSRQVVAAVAFAEAGRIAGAVRIAVPLAEVDGAVARVRRSVWAAGVLALLGAALVSVLAVRWMTRSVRAVADSARRIAAGETGPRTDAAGAGALRELSEAMESLASGLLRTMAQLREERDFADRVLAGMHEGVLALDSDGRVTLVNSALRAMLASPPDARGRPLLEVARHAELHALLGRVRERGEEESAEIEIGEVRPQRVLVRAAPLPGQPSGLLAVFVDVTDLRRLETVRRDFVANASHELRTPVATIRTSAEALRDSIERDPRSAARFVDIVERNAERLQRLVSDLLDLSRIESRELRLAPEPVPLEAVLSHVAQLFRDAADRKGTRIEVAAPDASVSARADRRALEQVLSNLVDNAVKYGPDGGAVVLSGASDGLRCRVSVANAGPGIEARHLPRLFERFYRVDAGRSRELGGTGLGLAIVRHFVEAMGGEVSVESEPERGTTFSFTLPCA